GPPPVIRTVRRQARLASSDRGAVRSGRPAAARGFCAGSTLRSFACRGPPHIVVAAEPPLGQSPKVRVRLVTPSPPQHARDSPVRSLRRERLNRLAPHLDTLLLADSFLQMRRDVDRVAATFAPIGSERMHRGLANLQLRVV